MTIAISKQQRQFKHVMDFFCSADLPSLVCFDSQLDIWKHRWMADGEVASEIYNPKEKLACTDAC